MRNPIRISRSAPLDQVGTSLAVCTRQTFGKLTRLDNRSRSPGSDPGTSKFLLQEIMRRGCGGAEYLRRWEHEAMDCPAESP